MRIFADAGRVPAARRGNPHRAAASSRISRCSHMTRRTRPASHARRSAHVALLVALLGAGFAVTDGTAATYPITAEQRGTAQRTAQSGVALSEILPNAPESYTVKPRDTLWGISGLFLKSPWRWPELWGMNLDEIRNPHLIYPGQVLFLDKANGRARLRMGQASGEGSGAARLSPRIRSSVPGMNGIASIPFHLIEPFLNEAVIFENNALASAPRIVAAQEGSVLLSRGDLAYVR